jgi:hypothetical protein
MKKLLIALVLLLPKLAIAKVNPSDYNLATHVQFSRLTTDCHDILGRAYCTKRPDLGIVINGKKLELLGKDDSDAALRTGDYKARILSGGASDTADPIPAYEIDDKNTYEFLFPDGKKQKYSIIGESEQVQEKPKLAAIRSAGRRNTTVRTPSPAFCESLSAGAKRCNRNGGPESPNSTAGGLSVF